MPPLNQENDSLILADEIDEADIPDNLTPSDENTAKSESSRQIVWSNVIWYVLLHLAAVYGFYLLLISAYWLTWLWTVIVYVAGAFGITAGAHRLWSHKSYKAKLPFRILLGIFNSIAFQNDIIEWARDHRVHHKYSETDADPHNAKRGFFFAHMGWLMVRKHPLVKEKGKYIDLSDLYEDPVCYYQRKYYTTSVFLLSVMMPMIVPWYLWGESLWNGFFTCAVFRYTALLHATWCVNSVAHIFGNRPYDRFINPAENFFVTFGAVGEGYHNYHHIFPSDYTTSEWGWKFNPTSLLIDFMASIGQVYDRKKMSYDLVFRRKARTGDGSDGFGYINKSCYENLAKRPTTESATAGPKTE